MLAVWQSVSLTTRLYLFTMHCRPLPCHCSSISPIVAPQRGRQNHVPPQAIQHSTIYNLVLISGRVSIWHEIPSVDEPWGDLSGENVTLLPLVVSIVPTLVFFQVYSFPYCTPTHDYTNPPTANLKNYFFPLAIYSALAFSPKDWRGGEKSY